MNALAVAVLCAGVSVDALAVVLWLALRPRRSTKIEILDWPAPAPVPAAMLRVGRVREYGNAELARVVRTIQPLIDSGRQPWSSGSFSPASSAPYSYSALSTPRHSNRPVGRTRAQNPASTYRATHSGR